VRLNSGKCRIIFSRQWPRRLEYRHLMVNYGGSGQVSHADRYARGEE
jgi:hypothetical protein